MCQQLNQEWEHLATEFKGTFRVAKLNISEGSNHELEETLQITNYPEIRYYSKGSKVISTFAPYQGVMKTFSIGEWLQEQHSSIQETVGVPILTK